MADLIWLGSVVAGSICFGAGMLAWMKNPRSKAAALFMLAMLCVFVALTTGSLYTLVGLDDRGTADALAKVFLVFSLLAQAFLWEITLVFPIDRKVHIAPPNVPGALILAGALVAIALGMTADVDFSGADTSVLARPGSQILVVHSATTMIVAMILILHSHRTANERQWLSSVWYLTGLWIFVASGLPNAVNMLSISSLEFLEPAAGPALVIGTAASGLVFALSIASGHLVMAVAPRPEAVASGSKASYKLLHRHVYLVEERKSDFSFQMFTDILKGRCFDCDNDESFACESLECTSCQLPCPCRGCTKYGSRAQGLVITRQYPPDVRKTHFIQTTPILWLSTVAGKDNLDPAKLALLTDFMTNFMEKSQNGVVLLDGVEYLVTSNDFARVVKAVDKCTEVAMTSRSRLVISVDPRAFSDRELALLEKNKIVIKPDEDEGFDAIT